MLSCGDIIGQLVIDGIRTPVLLSIVGSWRIGQLGFWQGIPEFTIAFINGWSRNGRFESKSFQQSHFNECISHWIGNGGGILINTWVCINQWVRNLVVFDTHPNRKIIPWTDGQIVSFTGIDDVFIINNTCWSCPVSRAKNFQRPCGIGAVVDVSSDAYTQPIVQSAVNSGIEWILFEWGRGNITILLDITTWKTVSGSGVTASYSNRCIGHCTWFCNQLYPICWFTTVDHVHFTGR